MDGLCAPHLRAQERGDDLLGEGSHLDGRVRVHGACAQSVNGSGGERGSRRRTDVDTAW